MPFWLSRVGVMANMPLEPAPELVEELLAREYGFPRHGNPRDPFYCAVYVLLSAQTTLEQASKALQRLRRIWRTPTQLAGASRIDIRAVVNPCGFGRTRTQKILAFAQAVTEGRRKSLRYLHKMTDEEVEQTLVSLPGIGVKTARVVAAMSSLQRDRFASDTHTWRVGSLLGWVPPLKPGYKPTKTQYNWFEASVPVPIRRRLHSQLVSHGREICTPRQAKCFSCCLNRICPSSQRGQDE